MAKYENWKYQFFVQESSWQGSGIRSLVDAVNVDGPVEEQKFQKLAAGRTG
jgi:hypothetical protein